MKQETFDDVRPGVGAVIALAILFAPPILEWMVNNFVDFITR